MAVELTHKESHGMQESRFGVIVVGPTTRVELKDELLAELPNPIGSLYFKSFESLTLIPGHTDIWTGDVIYGAYQEKQKLQQGQSEFRFNSVKEQITQTISPSSRCYTASGAATPEDLNIIGWSETDRKAKGIPRTVYYRAFSWRVAVPFSTATESWRRQADGLRGTVCSGSFFGYDAETVKMEDITGQATGSDTYTLDLSFVQKDHPGTLNIGGISVPNVKAWEDLDVDDMSFKVVTIGSMKRLIPTVKRVKVHYLPTVTSWSLLSSLLGV